MNIDNICALTYFLTIFIQIYSNWFDEIRPFGKHVKNTFFVTFFLMDEILQSFITAILIHEVYEFIIWGCEECLSKHCFKHYDVDEGCVASDTLVVKWLRVLEYADIEDW